MDWSYLRNVLKYTVSAILCFCLIFYLVYHISGGFSPEIETATAILTTQKNTLSAGAVLLRNETVLHAKETGDTEYLYDDGAKVPVRVPLVNIYAQRELSPENRRRIISLNAKIRLLENSNLSSSQKRTDTTYFDARMVDLWESYLTEAESGHFSGAESFAEDMLVTMNQRRIIIGTVKNYNDRIGILKSERDAIYGSKEDPSETIVSPASGYFYTTLDGYESIFSSENIDAMTLNDFIERSAKEPDRRAADEEGYIVGKLVTDFQWYTACTVNRSDVRNFSEGKTYTISFPHNEDAAISMELYRILSDINQEQSVLLFSTRDIPQDFNFTRHQTVSITVQDYEGYRIPASSVHIVDGTTGVYVRVGSQLVFRKINILYQYDGYLIVKKRDNFAEDRIDWLAENDAVVTGGKDLYHEKVIS